MFLDRKLAHREKFHRLHGFYGTLRENVEATDRFNLVAKEFDTNRMRVQKAVHIHDAAANRELPHARNHRLFHESVIQEPGAKRRRFSNATHLKFEAILHHRVRSRKPHQERIERAYGHKRILALHIPEKFETFFENPFKGDLLFVGFKPNRREKADKIFAQEPFQIFDPVFRTLVILCHHQNRVRLFKETGSHHHCSCGYGRPVYM